MSNKDASVFFGVSSGTVRNWAKSGNLPYELTCGGHRRFAVDELHRAKTAQDNQQHLEKKKEKIDGGGVIYARVSSGKQKDDLQRQVAMLREHYPNYEVFQDIGSKRKALKRLLGRVQAGLVKQVVVAHRDRLARFGTELIEWLFVQGGANLIVMDSSTKSRDQELTEDLMAIVTVFSCRFNGKRRYKSAYNERKNNKVKGLQAQEYKGSCSIEETVRREDDRSNRTSKNVENEPDPKTTSLALEMVQRCEENVQPGDDGNVERGNTQV